jgi:hypothetical protein
MNFSLVFFSLSCIYCLPTICLLRPNTKYSLFFSLFPSICVRSFSSYAQLSFSFLLCTYHDLFDADDSTLHINNLSRLRDVDFLFAIFITKLLRCFKYRYVSSGDCKLFSIETSLWRHIYMSEKRRKEILVPMYKRIKFFVCHT